MYIYDLPLQLEELQMNPTYSKVQDLPMIIMLAKIAYCDFIGCLKSQSWYLILTFQSINILIHVSILIYVILQLNEFT